MFFISLKRPLVDGWTVEGAWVSSSCRMVIKHILVQLGIGSKFLFFELPQLCARHCYGTC